MIPSLVVVVQPSWFSGSDLTVKDGMTTGKSFWTKDFPFWTPRWVGRPLRWIRWVRSFSSFGGPFWVTLVQKSVLRNATIALYLFFQKKTNVEIPTYPWRLINTDSPRREKGINPWETDTMSWMIGCCIDFLSVIDVLMIEFIHGMENWIK